MVFVLFVFGCFSEGHLCLVLLKKVLKSRVDLL